MNELKKLFTKKAILMFLCVSVLPYLLAALPKGIFVIVLTSIAIGSLIGFKLIKTTTAEIFHMGINLFHRLRKIATLSEDEFKNCFKQASAKTQKAAAAFTEHDKTADAAKTNEPPTPTVPQCRGSGIPQCCLVHSITDEQAQTIAREWWEEDSCDGVSGRNRVEDLIQEITASSPQTQTCQLGDFAEQLSFPKDAKVLYALQQVMQEDGLCADYNDDGYFVIYWGQDMNGKEAGKL